MDCKQVQNNLIFYYYGELPDEQRQLISQHLKTCKTCAAKYAKLRQVLDYAAAEAQTEPNPFLWTRIKAKLEQHNQQPVPGFVKVLQPILLIALVVVGLFLGIRLGQLYVQPVSQTQTLAFTQIQSEELFISLDQIDNTLYYLPND